MIVKAIRIDGNHETLQLKGVLELQIAGFRIKSNGTSLSIRSPEGNILVRPEANNSVTIKSAD